MLHHLHVLPQVKMTYHLTACIVNIFVNIGSQWKNSEKMQEWQDSPLLLVLMYFKHKTPFSSACIKFSIFSFDHQECSLIAAKYLHVCF